MYYSTLLDKRKNNIKCTWKILNTIIRKGQQSSPLPDKFMSNGKTVTHKKDNANGFNDFFVNVDTSLAKYINIPDENTHVLDYLKSENHESMFLASVEESEVINIVRNCKHKNSTGYDGIDMTIIKQVIYHISKPFTHIQYSFENGVFPSKMKIAKVVPIFKAGDKSSFNNYRSISFLPQFSKIVEKLFNARLDAFIDKHDTLTSSQYGFRSNMSTSLALLELTEEITSALDHTQCTIGVFIDLKKAFDTIDHGILLTKLNHYGIRGVANNWITSYLYNRQQYVNINDHESDMANVVCGVPQGSILGPKLFISYINDIRQQDGGVVISEPFNIERGVLQGDIFSPVLFIAGLDRIFSLYDHVNPGMTVGKGAQTVRMAKFEYADDAALIDEDAGQATARVTSLAAGSVADAAMIISVMLCYCVCIYHGSA